MVADTKYLIKLAFSTLNLRKKFSQIINSAEGFTILASDDPRKPDLLIVEIGEPAEKDMEHVQALLNLGETKEIFLTSDFVDPSLLMQAMRIGVKEFFSQPISEDEVRQAIERSKKRRQEPAKQFAPKRGQVFTVFGSKGGVGTTTLSVNIAVSLIKSDADCSVVLLDMNTLFGEIPLFLEMSPKFHWGEITKNIERLDNTFLSNILANHQSGVQVLPSPGYLNGHVQPTPEIMTRLLSLMRQMFDYIIIDGGQSTNNTSLKVLEISDKLLLVTILSLPCLANTSKLLKSFTNLGYMKPDNIKVVLNRREKKSEISLEDAEVGIGKEIYWKVPNDFVTSMEAINNGKPLWDIAPKARITKNIIDLANSLSVPKEEKRKKKWSLFR